MAGMLLAFVSNLFGKFMSIGIGTAIAAGAIVTTAVVVSIVVKTTPGRICSLKKYQL